MTDNLDLSMFAKYTVQDLLEWSIKRGHLGSLMPYAINMYTCLESREKTRIEAELERAEQT